MKPKRRRALLAAALQIDASAKSSTHNSDSSTRHRRGDDDCVQLHARRARVASSLDCPRIYHGYIYRFAPSDSGRRWRPGGFSLRRELSVDRGDRGALSPRRRRHQPLVGSADDAADADSRALELDGDPEAAACLLRANAVARIGDDWRIRLGRFTTFLSLLRSLSDTDVFPDRHLGW